MQINVRITPFSSCPINKKLWGYEPSYEIIGAWESKEFLMIWRQLDTKQALSWNHFNFF